MDRDQNQKIFKYFEIWTADRGLHDKYWTFSTCGVMISGNEGTKI